MKIDSDKIEKTAQALVDLIVLKYGVTVNEFHPTRQINSDGNFAALHCHR
jgi:hypothetical protein